MDSTNVSISRAPLSAAFSSIESRAPNRTLFLNARDTVNFTSPVDLVVISRDIFGVIRSDGGDNILVVSIRGSSSFLDGIIIQ